MEIISLLKELGVFGIIAFFIQWQLNKSAGRKFEQYRTNLEIQTRQQQSDLDSKLETYKSKLSILNYKSTKIYEQQLSAVIELYRKLICFDKEISQMTTRWKVIHPNQDEEKNDSEQINRAIKAYEEYFLFYKDNLILFPAKSVAQLDALNKQYDEIFRDYLFVKTNKISAENSCRLLKQANENTKNSHIAMEQLIDDFRKLLVVQGNGELINY